MAPLYESMATCFPRDPRTEGWVLGGNKQFLTVLQCAYVYVAKIGGPRFMKRRKPFDNIKPPIMIYDASMTALNCYFVVAFLSRTYLGGGYSLLCQGIDFGARYEMTMSLLSLAWWYLWVRIADFLDTIFFVLRKKDSHVSFLHVVHHVLVVFEGWFGLACGADGHVMFDIVPNSLVHVIMYSYYFLSLLGPSVQKDFWWKRYLTQIQMAQFVVMMTFHMLLPLFINCGYPKAQALSWISIVILFLVLFRIFYTNTYNRAKTTAAQKCTERKSR
ncbi:hypothetical protein V5799_000545 [Amblyomma americanum]|uniref:Elongation of very long chain fatty acids protein n=1 Tax=Amblyomma americanum TaxID=6943 RepID=A0AAQ4D2R2_AMBAM